MVWVPHYMKPNILFHRNSSATKTWVPLSMQIIILFHHNH